jgi:2-succinyl-5-enolpyruvyl-6-hydroxy-3-cyclohexene-1-carboxylate synthase
MPMNSLLSQSILLHLAQWGVREVCVAAGARNIPLVAAISASRGLLLRHFFEERSAGFFALGRMMADRRPVAVVTTSGTAVAELLPAVIEAHFQGLPLIVISADRPSAFRGSGAPQAIEQVGIFGNYAERTLDLEGEARDLQWPQRLSARPLHINVCFGEPLLSESSGIDFGAWGDGRPGRSPSARLPEIVEIFLAHAPDLVVLAAGLHPDEAEFVTPFLHILGAPIMAEATANLHAPSLQPLLMGGGESALRALNSTHILRIGAVPSWRWWRDIEQRSGLAIVQFSNAAYPGLARYQSMSVHPLAMLRNQVATANLFDGPVSAHRADRSARLGTLLEAHPLAEPAWMRHLSVVIPAGATVFLGNSLPIREWNLAAISAGHITFANRGANGIDGIVSSFFGSAAEAAESWLIVGDLTALYDLAAPWIVDQLPAANRRIVVINNGGGKIFSRVPALAALGPEALGVIENRHDLCFAPWAQLWGFGYILMTDPGQLADLPTGNVIIEVRPDGTMTEAFWSAWQSA